MNNLEPHERESLLLHIGSAVTCATALIIMLYVLMLGGCAHNPDKVPEGRVVTTPPQYEEMIEHERENQ